MTANLPIIYSFGEIRKDRGSNRQTNGARRGDPAYSRTHPAACISGKVTMNVVP